MSTVLAARALSKSFDGFKAVDGVDLVVEAGERRAVIGPNGAGKTTLFNLLTGSLVPDAGTVEILGVDLTGARPHRIAAAGVSRAFQVTSIFGGLTVRENVQLALLAAAGECGRLYGRAFDAHGEAAGELLAEVGLGALAGARAATLSHGDQRALELALSLARAPKVLLLDEPTAGMAPEETVAAMALVKRLVAERGITLLFCEHDMEVVFGTAERVTVMHQGRVLAEGTPAEVRADERVRAVYLGADDARG